MNFDQIEGKWDELKGYAKEKWGKLTDNDLTEIRGKAEQLKGKLQQRYGYTKEQVEKEVNSFIASHKDDCGCDASEDAPRRNNH